MRITPFSALMISFFTWLLIGCVLFLKGIKFLLLSISSADRTLFFSKMQGIVGGHEVALFSFLFFSLLIGFFKGRFVLKKTVLRLSLHFDSYKRSMSLSELYPRYYLFILASMMTLGMSMKWIPLPFDLRAFVDIAVGSALTSASFGYLKIAFEKKKKTV